MMEAPAPRRRRLLHALLFLAIAGCQQVGADDGDIWQPEIVARYPHDPNAFTQGLVFHDGYLYESTGRNGQSSVRQVDIRTGRVERLREIERIYFGEGLTLLADRLIQLTWQSQTGFVYRLSDFGLIRQFAYAGEGWGLTHDGKRLILSDGTATLRFLDPESFSVTGTVTVTDGGEAIDQLNELEYIDGEVWANIWYEDRIARIDPTDGHVLGWIDMSKLYPASERGPDAVVNGIAYDAASDRIFVTGKLWPILFEIAFAER
ncbi:MAG: glutaminyl-peptide cyclotransferase [Gammaproteobacteria bacterium]